MNTGLAFERRSIRKELGSLSFATVPQYALQLCRKEDKLRIHLEVTLATEFLNLITGYFF